MCLLEHFEKFTTIGTHGSSRKTRREVLLLFYGQPTRRNAAAVAIVQGETAGARLTSRRWRIRNCPVDFRVGPTHGVDNARRNFVVPSVMVCITCAVLFRKFRQHTCVINIYRMRVTYATRRIIRAQHATQVMTNYTNTNNVPTYVLSQFEYSS